MKNKILRRTIAIVMTLGMLMGSVSGHVTPVFATGEGEDTIVTEVSQEATQAPTEPEVTTVVEPEAPTEETTTVETPTEEPTPEVTTEAPAEEPTPEETTEAPVTEETTTAAPTEETTTAAPTETTTAPAETKEKTVKELIWDGGSVKITVSRKDGAEIPESSTLKVETLNSMNQSKSAEEELSIIKSFYEPAIDKIADEYGLDKESEAYKALLAGLLPFAVSIKDKNGKETAPEMNVKIEVKDGANEMYDLVYNKQIRQVRVAEFDAYKNVTLLNGDRASVSFDTAKGTYTAAAKTSSTGKYVVILYIDNDKVKEAQPKAPEQKDDSEEETDGEDADPDSEQPVIEEEPVVEETPAEEPEEVVEKSDRLLGGRMYLMDAADDDFPDRLKALADSYYGPDGHCDFPPVYVNVSHGPLTAADMHAPSALDENGFLSAGDTVYYRVEYALNAAQSWPGDPYGEPKTLYDYFHDISMEITMPAGLILEAAGNNYDIVPPAGSDRDLSAEHTYSISVPKLAPDENGHTLPTSGSFFIQVYVGNNGTANSINTYDLSDKINFEAKFDLLDKRKYETDPGYVVYTYTDSDTAGADPIKTKSPDIWGVEKSKKSDAVVKNGTATYTWTVAVGMRGSATGPLLTSNNDYNYHGRDGVTSITLTEALDAIFSKDNTHKTPTSVTIKKDGSSADPTVIDMNDPTVTIWGSGVSNDLKMNSMKLDADGDGSMTGSQDPESPVYTTYTITAVYSTTGLESDFFEAKNTLDSTNTVTMTANLANKEPQSETKSAPSSATMPVKDPASVNIRKYLQPGNGGSQEEYDNSKYGPITYTITKTDNSQFKVFTRSGTAPNYTYLEYADAQSVTLQPSIGNTVNDYYFLPGEYKITETIDSGHVNDMSFVSAKAQKTGSNTPVNGSNSSVTFSPDRNEAWTATFTNKECRGSIKINKKDGFATDSQPLAHAFFELTYPNGTKQTLETNDSGVATFSDLPYGTYILSEKSAPAGYAVNNEVNGLPKTIVIGDAQANYEYTFGNDITKAYVNLKKYVFRTEPTDTAKANDDTLNKYLATGNNQNCAIFVLQRSTNGTSWETAKDLNDVEIPAQSLNAQGQINLEVPSKDKNTGATYYYRFVETIKANDDGSYSYYPIEENPAGTFTNKPTAHTNTSLPQSTTAGGTMTFKMFNRQKVAVQVYKHYYHYKTNGEATNGAVTSGGVTYHESTADWTVPVTLYRYSGTGDPTSASQLTAIGTLNAKSSSTEAKWTDLVVYGENVTYTYYVKETLPTSGNGSDYTYFGLNTGSGYSSDYITFEDDENKEKYVKIDTSVVKSTYEVGFRNYLDAIPVRIRKFVGASGQTTLDGCSVTIYTDEACTKIATDAETGASLQNVTLPRNTTGAYIFLKSGQKYYYVETGIKSGYTFLSIQTDSGTTPSAVNKGVIDLTGNTQPAMANATTKYKVYDVRNKQNPGVLFTKKTMGRREEISGAKFDIYTRTGAGTASDPYVYTLAASLDMSSASTANVSLPAGTYYVTETQTPTGYLNPNTATTAAEYNRVATLYSRKVDGTNAITYYYDTAEGKTFTEITVSDTNKEFTFYNIYLKEKVQVQKRVDGANVSIPGFMVGIYKTDGNGNIVGDAVQTKMTDNNGLAKFENLDVYDADGNRIIYKVLEEDPSTWSTENDLANKYYKVADGQTFKLEIQTSSSSYNTKDLNGDTLTVDNATKLTVKVTKWQFDGYEYFHGGLRFKMEGVTIGLYRRLAGETEWVLVAQKDTDPTGLVAFDGLFRANAAGTKYEYALVELASNDPQYFPYFNGSVHDDAYPSGTGNLTDADLANYNSKVITAAQIGTDTEYDLGEMENSNHWVQFHLRKWLDGKSMQQNIAAGIGDTSGHRRPGLDPAPGAAGTGDTLLDDCVYSLYRMELRDGQTSVAFSRSDPWECIGTYTTGQLLDLNGDPVKAEFLSDIDTGINKNYVYVMVEDNVGPNGCIPNPYYEYTFWYSDQFEPNSITCTVNGVEIGYTFQYQMDTINSEETLNSQGEGPGTSNILLAQLRLAKWKDIYDANGNPSKVYEPLSNAHFEMSLTVDGQTSVIAYLTSGLNLVPTASGTQELAMAMTGTYQLILPGHKVTATEPDATHYYLKEYEVEGSASGVSYDVHSIVVQLSDPDFPDYNIYGIPVTINEVGAPEGFGYSQRDYDTYLIFVDKAPGTQGNKFRFYSDLYFVKTTDKTVHLAAQQQGRLWYATDADDVEVGDGPIQRIVDYPMTNVSVDIVKVGYAPSAATVALANEAGSNYSEKIATGNYGSKPLVGVTMKLQRYDEEEKKFKDWDYTVAEENSWGTKTFTTDELGRYFFPHGLPMGSYRVYETSLGSNDAEYENAYLQSANHYREFTVGGVPVTIYMANPEKIDLKINKINLGTNSPVTGMTFKLNNITAIEDPAGTYTFSNLATGSYKLTETGPANISTKFFVDMFAASYPNLAALVGDGMTLGLTYAESAITVPGEEGEEPKTVGYDVKVTAITPWESNQIPQLEVKNPPKTNITLKKYNLANYNTADPNPLAGAEFIYFSKPLESITDNITLPTIPDGTATADVRDMFTAAGWTDETEDPVSVPADGKLFENLEPGVYVFFETGAPSGFDIPVAGNNYVLYTAVVTGGLDFNYTVSPSSVMIGETEVNTYFESKTGAAVTVKAYDPQKASLKAQKSVSSSELGNADINNWSVTLELYEQLNNDGVITYSLVGSATINKANQSNPVTFRKGTATAYFSIGKTYYLKEVVNNNSEADADHFVWISYKLGEGPDAPVINVTDPNDYYPIEVNSVEGFTIYVTNQYLYGRVDFLKYNADKTELLSGAQFVVQHEVSEGVWEDIVGATVVEMMNGTEGTGRYKAFIPLDGPEDHVYRIKETQAPPDFVINPDPTKDHIDVTLSFENNYENFTIGDPSDGTYLTNEEGNNLEITKYTNVHGATNITTASSRTAKFSLYHYNKETSKWEWVADEEVEGNDGKILFDGPNMLAPGEKYAVAEKSFNHTLYNGLESIYWNNVKQELITIEAVGESGDVEEVKNAFVFTNTGYVGTIELKAYNYPYIKPVIRKLDVGQYPENAHADMKFKVLELPEGYDVTTIDDDVAEEMAKSTNKTDTTKPRVVFDSFTNTEIETTWQGVEGTVYGTTRIWEKESKDDTANILNDRWNPSKTYVLVEYEVGATDAVYDTMVKDDPRVEWYTVIDPVTDPDPARTPDNNPYIFTLTNINGVAGVEMHKDVVENADDSDSEVVGGAVDTLLEKNRDVVYTIDPDVTGKNQMLRSFVLEEVGLTAGTPSIPDWEITKIIIGYATQELPEELGLTTADMKADVEFTLKDGSKVSTDEHKKLDVSSDHPLDAPTGTVSFTITYYSEDVYDATKKTIGGVTTGYQLAEGFNPRPTTVYMTIKKIPESLENPATEITQFTNKAQATLVYPKWGADGTKPTDIPVTKDDTAVVNVNPVKLPFVSVAKAVDTQTAQSGHIVKYTLEVENKSSSEVDFVSPVLIDILPTGVTYYSDTASGKIPTVSDGTQNEEFTMTVTPKTGIATHSYTIDGVPYSDAESCVIFELKEKEGTTGLKPGSKITIEFYAQINESAVAYNQDQPTVKIRNDVYLSSAAKSYHIEGKNPKGYAFAVAQNADGTYDFGYESIADAANRDPEAKLHYDGVAEKIEKSGYVDHDPYNWVVSQIEIPVVIGSSLNISKAVKGDQDPGFHEKGVGIATRTVAQETQTHNVTHGTVDWRLIINNGQTEDADEITIGDVIPKKGDDPNRGSHWDVIFDHFEEIAFMGTIVPESDYTIYYYTGDLATAHTEVFNSVKSVRTWAPLPNDDHPNWSNTIPDNKASITAFMIVFKADLKITAGHTATITYHTLVKDYSNDYEFYGGTDPETSEVYPGIAYENATNDFYLFYGGFSQVTKSDPVSVTLLDQKVSVEGDVWIDEDWDNTQQSTGNRRDYSQYKIVQELSEAISFSITDHRSAANGDTWGEDTNHGSNTNPGYGESVRHFVFSDLGPAHYVEGRQLYTEDNYLNAGEHKIDKEGALKGDDPFHYNLNAVLDNDAVNSIFKLVNEGAGHYMSDNPDTELTASAANSLDSNFLSSSSKASSNYYTYPFYIRYSNDVDQSKDIGYRNPRSLEIKKVAADDDKTVIEGAKFEMYGPFGDSAMPQADGTTVSERKSTETFASGSPMKFSGSKGNYTVDPEGTITQLETDADGKIIITGLNWWKEYDIVEVEAGTAYEIEGATATGDDLGDGQSTKIKNYGDGKFTLMVPTTGRSSSQDTDKVTVHDPRHTNIELEATKDIENWGNATKFTFKLTAVNGAPMPEGSAAVAPETEKSITKDATQAVPTVNFGEITYDAPGTYNYTINEVLPSGATAENNYTVDGISYDPNIYGAVVTVVAAADGSLSASVKYAVTVKKPDGTVVTNPDGSESQTITNTYDAEGKTELQATKAINDWGKAESFEFTLAAVNNAPMPEEAVDGKVVKTVTKADPIAKFGEITYKLSDLGGAASKEFSYTITETVPADAVNGKKDGITYDTATHTVVVTVVDNKDGTLTATPVYDNDATADTATITNTYDAEGKKKLETTKAIDDWGSATSFTFKLTALDGAPMPGEATSITADATKTNPIAVFDEITYKLSDLVKEADGTYRKVFYYTINEVLPATATAANNYRVDGITYDPNIYKVKVTVVDQHDGTLKVTERYAVSVIKPDGTEEEYPDGYDSLTITNRYTTDPTTATPEAKKMMSGEKTAEPLTFTFTLTATKVVEDGAYQPADAATAIVAGETPTKWTKTINVPKGTDSNSPAFDIIFDTITFKKTGEYQFTIEETVTDADSNVVYDDTIWIYTVNVTDNHHGGLVAAESYNKQGASDDDAQTTPPTFTNEYVPTPTTRQLEIEKRLTGEPLYDAEHTQFIFTLEFKGSTVTGGYELPAVTEIIIPGSVVEAGGGAATAKFDAIKFTKEGLYWFSLKEKAENPARPKITYDDTEWYAYVEVVADAEGNLIVKPPVVYQNRKTMDETQPHAIFTNDYNPEDTSYIVKVKKVIPGEPRPEPDEDKYTFEFTLELISALYNGKDVSDGITIPLNYVTVTDEGEADFGQMVITKKGTYVFKIDELPGGNDHYQYDGHTWTLTLIVKDDADGNLYVVGGDGVNPVSDTNKVKYMRDGSDTVENIIAEFSNPYTPDPVDWHPSAKKIMDEEGEPTVEDKSFTFTIAVPANSGNPKGGATLPADPTVTVTVPKGEYASPVVDFGDIHFEKEGTYTFEITENAGTLPGVTYADGKVTLTIVIKNIKDQLTVMSVDAKPTGDMGVEVNSNNNPITATVSATNIYVPNPTKWQAQVKKLMKDSEPTVSDKKFTFTLTAKTVKTNGCYYGDDETNIISEGMEWTKTITVPKGATWQSTFESAFEVFDEITFTKANDEKTPYYVFTIKEESSDALPGIIYNTSEVTITFEVTDTDGQLVKTVKTAVTTSPNTDDAVVTVDPESASTKATKDLVTVSVSYTNRYEVKPVYYTPPVGKNVTVEFGPTVAEKIFYFDLELTKAESIVDTPDGKKTLDVTDGASIKKDSVTIVVKKGQTAADALFKQIKFSKAGTYTYKITEQIPTGTDAEEGITYTTVEWTMTVVVTDTDTGTPSALELTSVTYAKVAQQSKTPQQAADDGDDIKSVQVSEEKAEAVAEEETDTPEVEAEAEAETEELAVADNTPVSLVGADDYVFINDYKPEPVDWIPQVEKLLSEDSSQTKVDRIFDFEMKRLIKPAAGGDDQEAPAEPVPDAKAPEAAEEKAPEVKEPAAAKDGCSLKEGTTLYARTTLEATKDKTDPADWKSDPSRFYPEKDAATGDPTGDPVTVTFDRAGTYYFTVEEIMPTSINDLYPGFEYDVTVKEIAVTVTDIDGKLIVSLVTITDPSKAPEGGSAAAEEVYKVEITEKTETDEDGVERTSFETKVVIPTPAPEDPIVITTVPVTNHYYLGKIAIYKNLENHEDVDEDLQNGTERVQDPTTFVFSVEVEWSYPGYTGKVKVYSNVVSKVFTEAGEQLVAEIEDLPVGSVVTVKEIYTGGNYDLTSDETVTVNVIRDDPLTEEEEKEIANFDNAHNGNWKDGGSVTNTIDSDGNLVGATYADGRTSTPGGGESAEPEPQEEK